jgi:dTDP-4-dehydrorhamnose reductase
MKVLILGSNGQLGRCLCDQFGRTNYDVVYSSRKEINITNFDATKNFIFKIAPDLVINATAYTAVDKAEQDHEYADMINHLAVANIADICQELDCWFIHVSTDYVFDGNSSSPYKENDKTNPQSVYGDTKLRGEIAINSSKCKHIIVRTSWVFSEYGSNFMKTMLKQSSKLNELDIVGDQIGCPTYAQDLAKAIVALLPQLNSKDVVGGIYHYCGDICCSWFEFAELIFEILGKNEPDKKIPKLNLISSNDLNMLAKRPKYSVLSNDKINKEFNVKIGELHAAIEQVLSKLKESY